MSSINKLVISGVRSFSPNTQETITFFKPLTILVGHNGAGKTTIIECLRYACTGEFPPNSDKGKNFVHAPTVANEVSVKAKVQLKIFSRNGKPVVITRNLSATQRGKSLTFKTEASSLATIDNHGEKVVHSRRCADLNEEIPMIIGVSKAILECVVFCHQEDSNWPLAEPLVLKKKFDDIFASTQYTKALDAMKKEHKSLKTSIQVLEQKKQTAEERRNQVEVAQKTYDQNKRKCRELDEDLQRCEESIAQHSDRAGKIKQDRAAKRNELSELEGMRFKVKALEERYSEESGRLADDYSTMSTEEMQRALSRYEGDMRRQEEERNKRHGQVVTVRKQLEARRQGLEALGAEIGGLESDVRNAVNERTARDEVVVKLIQTFPDMAQMLPKQAPEEGYDDETVDKLVAGMREQCKLQDEERRERLRQQTKEKRELDDEVALMTKKLATHRERKAAAERRVEELSQQHDTLQQELRRNRDDFATRDALQEAITTRTAELDEAKRIVEQFSDAKVEEVDRRRQSVERDAEALKQRLSVLAGQAHDHAELRLNREGAEDHKRTIDGVVQAHGPILHEFLKKICDFSESLKGNFEPSLGSSASAVAETWSSDPSGTAGQLQGCGKSLSSWVEMIEKRLTRQRRDLTGAQGELKSREKDWERAKQELGVSRKALSDFLGEKNLSRETEETDSALAKNRRSESLADSALNLYQEFLNKMNKKDRCPLCQRGFESAPSRENLSKRLEGAIDKLPSKVDRLKREVVDLEAKLKILRELKPHFDKVEQLEESLPDTKNLWRTAIQERDRLEKEVASDEAILTSMRETQAEFRKLETACASLLDATEKRQKLLAKVAQIEAKLGDGIGEKSVDVLQRELEEKEQEARASTSELDALRRNRENARDNVHSAQEKLHEANQELLRVRELVQKIQQVEKQAEEVVTLRGKAQKEASDAADHSKHAKTALRQATEQREDMVQRHMKLEDGHKDEEEKFTKGLAELDAAHRKEGLEPGTKAGSGTSPGEKIRQATQQLEDKRAELSVEKGHYDSTRANLEQAQQAFRDADEKTAERDVTKRNIEDAMRVRKLQEELISLKSQVSDRERALRESGVSADRGEEALEDIEHTLEQFRSDRDFKLGERKTLTEEMNRLNRSQLAGAGKIQTEYEKAVVAVYTTQVAAADLERYRQALDRALMKYHAEKINEINRIIKELWQVTYQSADIDTIMVRADDGSTPAAARPKSTTTAAPTRKNYNYRLVMLKGGVELDMRGRCSAGQKVLASLIVRLALAETFCTNCGILTLDEPTTNLDRANIGAFARALTQLIEQRHRQSNFQLVIITHDEEFVQLLGRSEHADFYWRVSKNDQNHSVLAQCDIASMQ